MPDPTPQPAQRQIYLPNYGLALNVPTSYSDAEIDAAIARNKTLIRQNSPIVAKANQMLGARAGELGLPTVTQNGQTNLAPQVQQMGVVRSAAASARNHEDQRQRDLKELNAPTATSSGALPNSAYDQNYNPANPKDPKNGTPVHPLQLLPPSVRAQRAQQLTAGHTTIGDHVPGFDAVLADGSNDTSSITGKIVNSNTYRHLARGAAEALEPGNVAMLAAAPLAGAVLGGTGAAALGRGFLAQGAAGLAQSLANTDVLHKEGIGPYLADAAIPAAFLGLGAYGEAKAYRANKGLSAPATTTDGATPAAPIDPLGLRPPRVSGTATENGIVPNLNPNVDVASYGTQPQPTGLARSQATPFAPVPTSIASVAPPPLPLPEVAPAPVSAPEPVFPSVEELLAPKPQDTAPYQGTNTVPLGNAPHDAPDFTPTHTLDGTPVVEGLTAKGNPKYVDATGKTISARGKTLTPVEASSVPYLQQDYTEYPKPNRLQMLEFDKPQVSPIGETPDAGQTPQTPPTLAADDAGRSGGQAEHPATGAIPETNSQPAQDATASAGQQPQQSLTPRPNTSLNIKAEPDGSITVKHVGENTHVPPASEPVPASAEPVSVGREPAPANTQASGTGQAVQTQPVGANNTSEVARTDAQTPAGSQQRAMDGNNRTANAGMVYSNDTAQPAANSEQRVGQAMAQQKAQELASQGWELVKQTPEGSQLYRRGNDGLYRSQDGNSSSGTFASDSRQFNFRTRGVAQNAEAQKSVQPNGAEVSSSPNSLLQIPASASIVNGENPNTPQHVSAESQAHERVVGNKGVTYTPANRRVPFHYEVVPAESLITSHTETGAENTNYDQSLQPRDRSRRGSQEQIASIVSRLEPSRLAASPSTAEGSPLVGPDNLVESGNGRALAIRQVYAKGGEVAARYAEHLRKSAADFGIDPSAISRIANPALVRVSELEHATPADRAAFAAEAGQNPIAAMSATETAQADAKRLIESGTLSRFHAGDPASVVNPKFRRAFAEGLSPEDAGSVLQADGTPSVQGIQRMKNALLHAAYGDADAVALLTENPDNGVKTVGSALQDVAPEMAQMREQVANGERYPLDITDDIADAAKTLATLRENGTPVDFHLSQTTMFEEATPETKELLRIFDANKRSGSKIAAILKAYTSGVNFLGDPGQTDLFGEKTLPTKLDILEAAQEYAAGKGKTADFFADDGAEQSAAGEAIPAPPSTDTVSGTRDDIVRQKAGRTPQVEKVVSPIGETPKPQSTPLRLTADEALLASIGMGDGNLHERLDKASNGSGLDVTPDEAAMIARATSKMKFSKADPDYKMLSDLQQKFRDAGVYGQGKSGQLNSGFDPTQVFQSAKNLTKGLKDNEGLRQHLDELRNNVVEGLSGLHRQARGSADAVAEFAASGTLANLYTKIAVPKVTEGLSAENASRFQTYLVADRIAALREKLTGDLGNAADPKEAKGIRQHLQALSTLKDPVTGNPITEAALKNFFAKKDVAAALDTHKAEIEPVLEQARVDAGREANGIKGKYSDAFTPAYALDADGNLFRGSGGGAGSGGLRSAKATLGNVAGDKSFTGKASDYVPNYEEAIATRLRSGLKASTQRTAFRQLLSDGVAQDAATAKTQYVQPTETEPGGLQVEYNGKFEPAVEVTQKQLWNKDDPDIPASVVLPTRLWNEVEPAFSRETTPQAQGALRKVAGKFVQGSLYSIAEKVYHGASLTSRLGKQVPAFGDTPAGKFIKNWTPAVNSAFNIKNVAVSAHTDAERFEALKVAAKAGALPADFAAKGRQDGLSLYGRRGILANALTTLYKAHLDGNGDLTPQAEKNLRAAMRDMNTHVGVLRPRLQNAVQKASGGLVGTFYQTGMRNRVVSYHQPLQVLVAGLVGTKLLQYAAFKATDAEHRDPWNVPGYVPGNMQVGHDDDGKPVYFNPFKYADRTQGLGAEHFADSLVKSAADKDNALHSGENLLADAINYGLEPPLSGPAVNVASALSGKAPRIVPGDNLKTPNIMNSPTSKAGAGTRILAGIQAAVPYANALGNAGDFGNDNSPRTFQNKYLRYGAPLARTLGAPALTKGQNEAQTLQRARQSEQRALR